MESNEVENASPVDRGACAVEPASGQTIFAQTNVAVVAIATDTVLQLLRNSELWLKTLLN